MKSIEALKTFIEARDPDPEFASLFPPRKITMDELKALTKAERDELAALAAKALNVTLET